MEVHARARGRLNVAARELLCSNTNKGSKPMRTYLSWATLGFALFAGASDANAQSLVTSPSEVFIVQPSGTLIAPVPLVAVSAGVLQPVQTIQTIQTVQVVRPVVRQQIVASHRTTVHRVAAAGSSRPLYNYVPPARAVQRVVAPVVVTGQVLNLSGQFQCVEGCAGGQPGPVFVTQNRWDLNLVNELGQPTRAWVDWPGHIWTESWNEGAVYSPDGITIQFDNGTVWRRNIELLVLPSVLPQGR
jgi:hypothetical protein